MAESGRRPAFIAGTSGEVVSWANVGRCATALAGSLPRDGVVGVSISSPATFCAAYIAALAGGITIAPLDPRATEDELDLLLDRLLVTDLVYDEGSSAAGLDGSKCRRWQLTQSGLEPANPGLYKEPPVRGIDASVVLATSGTTGRPKAVPLQERQLLKVARDIVSHHGLRARDRGYSPLPLFHVNAQVVGVLSALVSGSSLVIDDRFHRSRFWEVVESYDVTWLNLVPAMIALLGDVEPPAQVAKRIRFARSASAPLPEAVREKFEHTTGIGILETYGMTEAASQITANPLETAERRPGSVGRPVGVSLQVVDEKRRPVPAGEVGSIEIRGRGVVTHYLDTMLAPVPVVTDDGWLVTGDLGRVDTDGFVYLVGRADEVINRGGEKLYPREIEEVLRRHPAVLAAAVVGRPHPVLGSEPVAFVTVRDASRAEVVVEELTALCRQTLSRYKQPAEIIVIDELPAGATGKVSRRRVAELAAKARISQAARPAPALRREGAPPPPSASKERESLFTKAFGLELPSRPPKPRRHGLNVVIDGGVPLRAFEDAVSSSPELIDLVKLGWGTAVVTRGLEEKIAVLKQNGIAWFFGGTLFEKFVAQDRFGDFVELCRSLGCSHVEVSNGTIHLPNYMKATYIERLSEEFTVLSEVGYKDVERSDALEARDWLSFIYEDLAAGAAYAITEARESGHSGICNADGGLRVDVVEEILTSDVDTRRLVFEAPTKELQSFFVTRVGTNVNLANLPLCEIVAVETLRLGLRSDTLLHFELERQHVGELSADA